MQYLVEELPFKRRIMGLDIEGYIDTEIEITDWVYTPADPGVPYNGGQNLPEPSYPEYYEATDFDICSSVNVMFDIGLNEFEMEINIEQEEYRRFGAIVKKLIDDNLDWEHVNELLTEYNRE